MHRLKLLLALAFLIAFGVAFAYAPLYLSASAAEPPNVVASTLVEYTDDVFSFRVSYPADYAVREYAEDEPGARTIVFEGESPGLGFQVFVVPYNKPDITRERFLTDDPSGVIDDEEATVVDGVSAKSFFGYNNQMGDTREVWFIKNSFLYEVTAYKSLALWLDDILSTWRFL